MRTALPMASGAARALSLPAPMISMRRSMSASISSGSLNPSAAKILMPLSWYGLCDALMTTPASARIDQVMKAIPGVGSGPTSMTSAPAETIPACIALSSM